MVVTANLRSPAIVDPPLPSLHRPLPSSNHAFPPVSHPFDSLFIFVWYPTDSNFAMEVRESLISSRLLDQAWDGTNALTPTSPVRARETETVSPELDGTGSSASENAVSPFTAMCNSQIQWDWIRGRHWCWPKCDERPRGDYVYSRPIRSAFGQC